MRTTLTIDDDVLTAAKAIARQQRRSVGEVVSDMAPDPVSARNGIALLSRGADLIKDGGKDGAVVTLETVNALRDELP